MHPSSLDAPDPAALATASVALIAAQQAPSGAYPASPTFSAYAGYSWFRDGAFIADAMSAAGEKESAESFFDWCAGILLARAEQVGQIVSESAAGAPPAPERMLATRFTLAGENGDDHWWDFQLDGYGTWLWALGEHIARHGGDARRWSGAVALTVDYLTSSWSRPCYDWWEEHPEHVHGSTLGCIVAGLRAAASLGVLDDERREHALAVADAAQRRLVTDAVADAHLVKWIGSAEMDASLAAIVGLMAVLPAEGEISRATVAEIERQLTVDGGVHRFRADTFYGGGQWPLLSCFLGIAHVRAGNRDRAQELLDWAASTADDAQLMPEQVDRVLRDPAYVQEWVQRWGPVARPLLWSHAMLIRLAVELGQFPGRQEEAP